MSKSTECLFEGRPISLDEAISIRYRKGSTGLPLFSCIECGERVDAHREGRGSPARFEHRTRNPKCSLSHLLTGFAKRRPVENCITTAELATATSGGDDYIRTRKGIVVGLALTPKHNPRAPEVVIVGKGPRIQERAALYLASGVSVPTYMKRGTNAWELIGQYQAIEYRTDFATIDQYCDSRPRHEIAGILFLERTDEVSVSVRGGGFASPETRKAIEDAAVTFVKDHYESLGYTVEDFQKENKGYDLTAVKGREVIKLEVKGTDATVPRFFLTRNEYKCAKRDPEWLLAVVSTARQAPQLRLMSIAEVEQTYEMDALAWECLPQSGTSSQGG